MSAAGVGWDDLGGVATTQGPGLIGALLVGLAAAKAIAYRRRLPLIPVNHLQGHIAANYALGVEAPFVCLVASGGHTLLAVVEEGVRYRVAARTMDDAAGEAFDKGARLLGLGYPGGKELDLLAARGDARYARFPRAVPRGRDFSFSGLKTALLYDLRERDAAEVDGASRRHRRLVPGGDRRASSWRRPWPAPPARACAAWPSPAASPPTPALRAALAARCGPSGLRALAAAAQPLHRQRRHDRPGGRVPAGACPGRSTSASTPSPATPRPRRRGPPRGGRAAG